MNWPKYLPITVPENEPDEQPTNRAFTDEEIEQINAEIEEFEQQKEQQYADHFSELAKILRPEPLNAITKHLYF